MNWKLISGFEIACRKPGINERYYLPVVRQATLRWYLLLRAKRFMLPDFLDLEILVIEKPSVSNIELELDRVPSAGPLRALSCYVPELPDEPLCMFKHIDSWIFECFSFFCEKDSENLRTLEGVFNEISQNIDPFALVPIKVKTLKNVAVSLGTRACGPHPYAGELFITATNLISGESVQRKLFDYVFEYNIFDLCGKISITKDVITIMSKPRWVRWFPDLPSKILISLAELFRTDEESKWLLSDVSSLRRQFARVV